VRHPVVAAIALALLYPAWVQGQGLGGAAKKEKDRRAKAPAETARTYTSADLPASASGESAETDAHVEPTSAATPAGASPGTEAGNGATERDDAAARRREDEAAWRARVADARARVADARAKHDTLAHLNLVPGYEYVDKGGHPIFTSVEQLQAATAKAKANVDSAERAVEQLLEQARHANVPPGWLR